jgi:hypothetical protein
VVRQGDKRKGAEEDEVVSKKAKVEIKDNEEEGMNA